METPLDRTAPLPSAADSSPTVPFAAAPEVASSPTGHRPGRNLQWIGVIGWEFLHAALWIPQVILLIPSILVFHLTVPLWASLERIAARRLGTDAPSGRKEGERKSPWLLARVAHAEFWRQDLPLCLGALMLTTVGFFLTTIGGLLAITCIAIPFMATPDRPIRINACAVHVVGARAGEIWWTAPIGVAVLVLTLALLLGLGALRTRMVEALSENRQAKRIEALTAEVGHLLGQGGLLEDGGDRGRHGAVGVALLRDEEPRALVGQVEDHVGPRLAGR